MLHATLQNARQRALGIAEMHYRTSIFASATPKAQPAQDHSKGPALPPSLVLSGQKRCILAVSFIAPSQP
jgi:hypothetical protein